MSQYKNDYTLKDSQKLILRSPKERDAQSLIDLMQTVDSETKFLGREPGEFNFTLEQEKEFIKAKAGNNNGRFLVAELNGEIIGSCHVEHVLNQKRYLHRAAMAVTVKKDYWNRGIGSKMMQECISWCKEKGVEQLELEVVTQNERAVSLYKKFGFDVSGTKKHTLKYKDGTYADEYIMCLFFNDIKPE